MSLLSGLCERVHREVGNIIRTAVADNGTPRTKADAQRLVDSALAQASRTIRSNISTGTGYTPGELAFHRDMLLNLPPMVDLLAVRNRRQVIVDENLRRVNAKRSSYDYNVQQQVLKKRFEYTKLGDRWEGSYTIDRVHTNSTISIRLAPGVTERINILRRVKPYHAPNVSTSASTQQPSVPDETPAPRTARFTGTYSAYVGHEFFDYWF